MSRSWGVRLEGWECRAELPGYTQKRVWEGKATSNPSIKPLKPLDEAPRPRGDL